MSRLSSLGAAATLLDPAEVAAPLLQQPLHLLQDEAAAPQWMLGTPTTTSCAVTASWYYTIHTALSLFYDRCIMFVPRL